MILLWIEIKEIIKKKTIQNASFAMPYFRKIEEKNGSNVSCAKCGLMRSVQDLTKLITFVIFANNNIKLFFVILIVYYNIFITSIMRKVAKVKDIFFLFFTYIF